MVMPASGTFDYVAVVPDDATDGIFECPAKSREDVPVRGSDLSDNRLVGLTPRVAIVEAGLTPDSDKGLPWVMRARLTLTAESRRRATVAEFSFHVDRAAIWRTGLCTSVAADASARLLAHGGDSGSALITQWV